MFSNIFAKIKDYFDENYDLMRHLDINACWEYIITENDLNQQAKCHFFLIKTAESNVLFTTSVPELQPDLTLYFTEKAILTLIESKPTTEEYYRRYRYLMNHPQPGMDLDTKINKPRLKLLKIGYRNWQKEFRF
jgi:hypothetical protein